MSQEQLKMLENYIRIGVSPILVENKWVENLESTVELKADCPLSLLNGHYEETEFVAPSWYHTLCAQKNAFLIIRDIDQIPPKEQTKFVEILKYKKISTFDLPPNCTIFVTKSSSEKYPIAEEVYTLLAHI